MINNGCNLFLCYLLLFSAAVCLHILSCLKKTLTFRATASPIACSLCVCVLPELQIEVALCRLAITPSIKGFYPGISALSLCDSEHFVTKKSNRELVLAAARPLVKASRAQLPSVAALPPPCPDWERERDQDCLKPSHFIIQTPAK